jgi:8-amino-7-oxononanoate synthase
MPRLAIERSTATTVEIDGRELLYFGGCGYLGLAHHRDVTRALGDALARNGVSSGASRETSGNSCEHDELERELAQWLGAEAALLVPEGYIANLALTQSLAPQFRVALIDEHGHPSLFDGAAAAGMRVVKFAHMDAPAVAKLVSEHARERVVVMTDSVFPSRGEIAPLAALHAALDNTNALLVVDDCHGLGVIGASGHGALEHAQIRGERVIVTTTLSKALGCYGGAIVGAAHWIDLVRRESRAYIGTTPIPPAVAAAARVASKLALGDGRLLAALRSNCALLRGCFESLGLAVPRCDLPVFAFSLATAVATRALHEALLADRILAPYTRYPGDEPTGNMRVVVNSAHRTHQIQLLFDALARHLPR